MKKLDDDDDYCGDVVFKQFDTAICMYAGLSFYYACLNSVKSEVVVRAYKHVWVSGFLLEQKKK